MLKRRLKITVTKIRRTRTPEKHCVMQIVCPVCEPAVDHPTVVEPCPTEMGDNNNDRISKTHILTPIDIR